MVEILAVIIILGLILAIAVPAVNKHLAEVRIEYYKNLESSALSAGKDFIAEKRLSKPNKLLNSNVIKLSSLEKESFIDEVKDYLGKKCDSTDVSYSYIVVVKTGDKQYDYQVCLRCSNDEYVTDTTREQYDYCNPAWMTNEHLDYVAPGDSDDVLYVQYGTSEEEIKPQVGLNYKVLKKDEDGNILREVVDQSSQKIYPDNINELIGANVNKRITLKFTIPNGTQVKRDAIIYRHLAPNISATYINANGQSGKNAGDVYNGNAFNEWASGVKFALSYSPSESDLVKSKIKIADYEYYVEGSDSWNKFPSGSNVWNIVNNYKKKVKFRFKNEFGQYSQESRYYYISVDSDVPICSLEGTSSNVKFAEKKDSYSGLSAYGMNIGSKSNPVFNNYSSISLSKGTVFGYVRDAAGNVGNCSLGVYTLNFDTNGGGVVTPSSKLLPTGVDYGELPKAVKGGNKFDGWTTTKDGSTFVTSAFKMGSQDVTIYAHYTECGRGEYSDGGACYSCPTFYSESEVGAKTINECYRNVSGSKYIATAKATLESSCGTGTYKAPHMVYYGQTSSCSTCPTGYRDGAATIGEYLCSMNVSGAKYVSTAKSATQSTCGTGTYKAAHVVLYGQTSRCTACPTGYKDGAGTTEQSLCKMNVPGTKYVSTAKSATQSACAKGTYKAAHVLNYGETSSCSSCPSGYTDGAATTAQTNCVRKVTAGNYLATANATTNTACAKGYYKAAHDVKYGSTSSCSQCPSGYRDGAGTTAQTNCVRSVAAGNYIKAANDTTNTACGTGTYKGAHTVKYGSTSSCTSCPSGYKDGAGTTAQGNCVMNVAAGKYVGTANSATQTTCATGYYKGAHTVKYGGTSSCSQCPSGYRDGAGTTAQTNCVRKVIAGNYLATANATTNTACAKGYYKAAHTVKYGGTSSCSQCPSGYRDGAGTTAQSNCVRSVAAGNYIKAANATTNTACGTGTYKGAHTVKYGSTSSCTSCPTGYKDGAGTTAQSKCKMNVVANKYVKTAKDATATACASGYQSAAHTVSYGGTSTCTQSYPNVTLLKTSGYYVCPSNNVGVQNRPNRNSACKQGNYYNRMYIYDMSYSNGILKFTWNIYSNYTSPTWDSSSANTVCIAKLGATTCYNNSNLGSYNVKPESPLYRANSTWGAQPVTVDLKNYAKGTYKVIAVGTEKMAFSMLDYTDIGFFTVN